MNPIRESSRRLGALADRGGPIIPIAIVCLILVQIVATRSASLFTNRLQLDEYHTLLLVEDPDLPHSMEALKHGADVNVPALYLLNRLVTRCVGSTDPVVLRGTGFAAVVAGITGLYLLIRRVYSPDVAFIAALVPWTHPIVLDQAFQARFYGPWFAGVIWFALALNFWDRSRSKFWPGLLVAATATFVCTIHYFGVFSLMLVALAHTIFVGKPWRSSLARLIPVAAGPLALAAFLPFYFGQKATLSVPTWIPPPSAGSVIDLINKLYKFHVFAIPVCGLTASLLLARRELTSGATPGPDESRLPELAGVASLGLFPVLLIAFSYMFQSVLADRYFIVTVASFSVLIGPVLSRTARPIRWAVLLGVLALGSASLITQARTFRAFEAARTATARVVEALPNAPILFKSRATLYELRWDLPRFRERYFLMSPDDFGERSTDILKVESSMARNHLRWYGMPRSADLASLKSAPVFFVVGLDPEDLGEIQADHPELSFRLIDADRPFHEVTVRPPGSREPHRDLGMGRFKRYDRPGGPAANDSPVATTIVPSHLDRQEDAADGFEDFRRIRPRPELAAATGCARVVGAARDELARPGRRR